MIRISSVAFSLLFTANLFSQQMMLDWATPTVPTNHRVRTASNGDVFAMGRSDNSVVLQRISSAGVVLWTKTLSAPTLMPLDMDVDGSDNIYIVVGFSTGQLDLDPGPNNTLVNPGKAYAKYTSNGQFQWGFGLENQTDMSGEYCALSCDDAGNIYICGDLGEGTFDFDPGTGVQDLVCPTSSTGSYVARYHTDGTLAWANMYVAPMGTSNSRDIAVMRDGSSFYMVRVFDNGFPGSQIDVDPGPNVVNVYCDSQNLMRYDSTGQFMAQHGTNYYQCRLAVDASGAAYVQSQQTGGVGAVAWKYTNGDGAVIDQVYSTNLYSVGSMSVGDVVADGQGGCIGMYTLNCNSGTIRFYKMNVSGLVDFNLFFLIGTDCYYPFASGFDLDGNAFYMGTFNNGHDMDYDPGADTQLLPGSGNDGVVARYDWCAGVPYDPFEIAASGVPCVNSTVVFNAIAFGDASSYTWTVPPGWTITIGQGTASIGVIADTPGTGDVSVVANNVCGSSAPISVGYTFIPYPLVDLGPDTLICLGSSITLVAPSGPYTYSWSPGGEFTQSIMVAPTNTTNYSVEAGNSGCSSTDAVTVVVDPCLGVPENTGEQASLWPVPVVRGASLHVLGVPSSDMISIVGMDGRTWPFRILERSGAMTLNVDELPVGSYALRTKHEGAIRFVLGE